jgi:hypothetical protein
MLSIDHVPNTISVRAALTASDVDERATVHYKTTDALTVAAVTRAIATTPEESGGAGADLRYAIVITDAHGKSERIYLDAFGLRGTINGRPVRFANDGIKRAIVKAYPKLAE